ncbi:MAG: hypothetical protein Q7U97_16755, partial [Rhodocyclaceae bacterium]|nr:hypothetical protein [Rhodocyclaceae bacterium]
AIYWIDGIASGGSWISDYNDIGPKKTGFLKFNNTAYNDLSVFQAAASRDTYSISSDPLFTDPVNQVFTLQGNSPCINAGVEVYTGMSLDSLAPVNMGSFQSVKVATPLQLKIKSP